jgi:protein required for attachment to host cells
MKPKRTLVLLADDAGARLFENNGIGKGLYEIEDLAKTILPDTEIRYADRAGRGNAPGGGHHGYDPSSSEEEQMRAAFADHVVKAAEARWNEVAYERFAMAAAPRMLGVLRAKLPKPLMDALVADLDKDLMKLKAADVAERFADQIVF